MMQKRNPGALMAAALLMLTGCGDSGSSSQAAESSVAVDMNTELVVDAAETVDPDCAACIRTYFTALEEHDFTAYQKTVYPPYQEVYAAYLAQNGDTLEGAFKDLYTRFDEDGYESWHLTEISLAYYDDEETTVGDFFSRYINSGIFDEEFEKQTRADAAELHDVIFSLDALYAGDSEPVTVIERSGIVAVKNADGWYVFG
ncbi:MAG: hypothetical protein IJ060_02455 [Oscillospiraceae bacterium]|nr:hypothetical protein [Oscillospiraceae bacterium]